MDSSSRFSFSHTPSGAESTNFSNPQISVIAPCLNEEGNISELIARTAKALQDCGLTFEIVLIDDGSSDGTWEIIKRHRAEFPSLVVGVQHETNLGIYRSWQSGIAASRAENICLIDSDLQNPPEAICDLWRQFDLGRGALVQGTRSSIEWDRDARYIASRGLNWLLNRTFGDRAQDNKSGFVMAPRHVMEDVLEFDRSYKYPQTFIRVAARSKGYAVSEIETLFRPRVSGQSFLSARSPWRVYGAVILDVLKARREFGRGVRNPLEDRFVLTTPSENVARNEKQGVRSVGLDLYFATMPLHAWLIRPKTKDLYYWLNDSQWLSSSELQAIQFSRLRQLLWHAYIHVPYYRKVFDEADFHPSDFQSLGDIANVPLLSKRDVTANLYMSLFSDTHVKDDMHKIATSGSTGQPFVTYADRNQLEFRFASTLRSLEWTGWRFGDRQVRLWHQRLGMSPSQVFRERMDAFMMKRTFVPAFELDEKGLRGLVRTLNRVKPVLIDGYAESLNFLALYLAEGQKLDFAPKGLMSSAQVLTSQTRAQIEQSIGSRVFDKYGAREFSGIAYQCEYSDDKHVMDESYVVELLKDGRTALPGETGEVVITDLNNFSVPLIRYRIGDLAVAVDNQQPCACGRGLSRIGSIQGRTQALVHCANGRWLPGTFFAHFFKDYEHLVRFFQVYQEERDAFILRVVKAPQWTAGAWNDLLVALRTFVGPTDIQVDYVDEIPLLRTGKRTPVISTLQMNFQSL